MAFGSQNDFMIFPLMNLIKQEIRRAAADGTLADYGVVSTAKTGGLTPTQLAQSTGTTTGLDLLEILESNDYQIEFEKKDLTNTKMLTGVIITFRSGHKQLIGLVRENGKLTGVKISLFRTVPTELMLLKIIISLVYNLEGYLIGVKSET